MQGKIYIVSTPIGNKKDITYRAIEILKEVDIIACENKENNQHFIRSVCGTVNGKIVPYYDGNEKIMGTKLVQEAMLGKSIAIISSAGTPLICDPGYKMIQYAVKKSVEVIAVPGPCSVIAALTCSGCPTYPFTFFGFFPKKTNERTKILEQIVKNYTGTVLFFESSHRIRSSVALLYTYFIENLSNQYMVVLIKDITKASFQRIEINQEKYTLFSDHSNNINLGEWIIIIAQS